MAKTGNPITFKDGEFSFKKVGGTNIIKAIIESGSVTDSASIVDAKGNCVGMMRAAGLTSVEASATCYISTSATGQTGTSLDFKPQDLVECHIKNGMLELLGEFMVESFESSLDPEGATTLQISVKSNGDLTTRTYGVVSCTTGA